MAMADTCPDHGKRVIGYCGSCVRPLCSKCDVSGTVPRCAECRGSGPAQAGTLPVGRRSGLGTGGLVLLLLAAAAAVYLFTMKSCPLELPGGLEWKRTHTDRKD